jgi:hypothetical protein
LKILEEFRKIPISKFLLNLLVQISKAFVNSKTLFYSKRNFPCLSTQSAQLPAGPLDLLAHPAQPASFFLLLHRSRARKPPSPAGLTPPPWSSLTTSVEWKKSPCHPSFISPLYGTPSRLQSSGNRCLQSGSIEAPSTSSIEGTRPSLPRFRPTKGRPAPGEDPDTSNSPSLSPHCAHTIAFWANVLPPVHRLLIALQALVLGKIESLWCPPSFPHLAASRRGSEPPQGLALVSSIAGHGGWSTMDHALHWSMTFPIRK